MGAAESSSPKVDIDFDYAKTAAIPEMECDICFYPFNSEDRSPKVLKCGHCFCLLCLGKIFFDSNIFCPTCRVRSKYDTIEEIPKNFILIKMLKKTAPQLYNSGLSTSCQIHHTEISGFCKECQAFHCEKCFSISNNCSWEKSSIENGVKQLMPKEITDIQTYQNILQGFETALKIEVNSCSSLEVASKSIKNNAAKVLPFLQQEHNHHKIKLEMAVAAEGKAGEESLETFLEVKQTKEILSAQVGQNHLQYDPLVGQLIESLLFTPFGYFTFLRTLLVDYYPMCFVFRKDGITYYSNITIKGSTMRFANFMNHKPFGANLLLLDEYKFKKLISCRFINRLLIQIVKSNSSKIHIEMDVQLNFEAEKFVQDLAISTFQYYDNYDGGKVMRVYGKDVKRYVYFNLHKYPYTVSYDNNIVGTFTSETTSFEKYDESSVTSTQFCFPL